MPFAPPRPCNQPGCGVLVSRGARYCDTHRRAVYRAIDERRGKTKERGYGGAWRRLRAVVLQDEPLCRMCKEEGHVVPANEVDHEDGNPHNNARSNLRPLCKRHHSSRTARDQGFARPRARP